MKHSIFFEKIVLEFYRKCGRKHLPWRADTMNSYKIWVSEIMLQQTQVDRVIGFYTRFLERFPDINSLSRASWEDFLPYYKGLGYYNRGKNMLVAAKQIVKDYGGEFPREISKLERLPGIGVYTARAIVSFAHADNHLAWDTNFSRVFGRFFYGSKDAVADQKVFKSSIHANKKDFNGAIMDFGSLVCVKRPKCNECPLSLHCVYFSQKGKKEKNEKRSEEKFPMKDALAAIILHKDNRIFYSSRKRRYVPFFISSNLNSRSGIQNYFLEKYGLSLSVRPPHLKRKTGGKPVIFVRAQVLLGQHAFSVFSKKDVSLYMKDL